MDYQKEVKDFMTKAGQSVPLTPTIPDEETRILRVKMQLEEVFEFAEASGVKIGLTYSYDRNGKKEQIFFPDVLYEKNEFNFEISGEPNLEKVYKENVDILYINVGTFIAYGLDMKLGFEEVQSSNLSKLIDGSQREDGKWLKGPSYREADMSSVLELLTEDNPLTKSLDDF